MTGSPSLQSDAICIVDVGSTTTKAILFRRDEAWRCERYEAPTTVEKPEEDVIIGVRRALAGLAERSGRALLRDGRPLPPFLCTSSAGGGLAMVVTGLVREVTTRSAERVALGAGAILLDVIAMDDGRTPYEKIEALRRLRPDMVLLAGGFDGEALSGPVFLAELIREAGLRPKLSAAARLPVIYAGNANAREFARRTLGDEFHFHAVPNLRPASEREHLEPAREAIHEVFMEHVMSQAPGYEALKACVTAPILPTPAAFAGILALASREMNQRILAVDIGGATTDVFTAHGGHVLRTVSANLGMSYSILEVARRGGLEAIRELIRADGAAGGIGAAELWDEIGAKHLRPTRLPADERQREIERAVGAVAIREAVREHLQVLRGVGLSRAREELHLDRFGPRPRRRSVEGTLTLEGYDLVIGSGGLLSHSPRAAAARILADALRPRRKTELAVDSAFMFPHLGALARLDPPLALRLFRELGLVRLAGAEEPPPGEDPRPARGEGPAGGAGWAAPAGGGERPLRLRRELAIPGEVFVAPGERVGVSTPVARSTRQFLRPFFLDAASRLGVPPDQLVRCLLKRVGDVVRHGEVIAERRVHALSTKRFLANVEGRVERILPNGTLIVRENPEDARRLTAVQAARDLGVSPEGLRPHVRVEPGQPVERGHWLASVSRPGAPLRTSVSPVRGRVRDINLVYGVISIEPLLESLEVRAWLPGRVVEVSDRGCVVEGEGLVLTGVWGLGNEASGPLEIGPPRAGSILVRDHAHREELESLAGAGIAGLVTGSLRLGETLGLALPYPVVMMQGFGTEPLEPELRAMLGARAGRLALIDGTTELRVGVRRPFVILTREEPGPEGEPGGEQG